MNNTDTCSDDCSDRSEPVVRVVAFIMCLTISITGAIGNSMTIVSVWRNRALQKHINIFIVNLAVSDLIGSVVVMPTFSVGYLNSGLVFSCGVCRGLAYLLYLTLCTSMMNIMLIAVSRYIYVAHNHKYREIFTDRITVISVVTPWVLAGSFLILPAAEAWGRFKFSGKTCCCAIDRYERAYLDTLIGFFFVVPIIITTVCYVLSFRTITKSRERLRRSSVAMQNRTGSPQNQDRNEPMTDANGMSTAEIKLLKSLLVVFAIFLTTNSPFMFGNLIDHDNSFGGDYYVIEANVIFCTYAINPVVYVVMNKRFREVYKVIFRCSPRVDRWIPDRNDVSQRTTDSSMNITDNQ